ncbi:flagellar brake protein [Simiduia agarivorans]|uniref:Acetolactate synthase small subunit n=1 Tax=Simiduia agarivorans (strain DSM 21679 / JCM 13881 / BCRC 17597 / SA1) TaxID=1117647 RepID=K4KYV6_SIMAS|nr:flagellar brake protein [Simiduia agarivorans]AFU99117.1 acetolactate synthase small subunit [Simiduia agarivorans SA1 = DSM 21679]
MNFEDLQLKPGTVMQLDLDLADGTRATCRFVGYIKNRALLVTLPASEQAVEVLAEQGMADVHVFSQAANAAMLFTAPILGATQAPVPVLWLGYPAMVMRDESRKAERVAVQLETRVLLAQACDAKIIDLSISGCCLEVAEPVGAIGDQLTLEVKFPLPEGIRQAKVTAVIRAVLRAPDTENANVQLGMAFDRLSEPGKALLQACIDFSKNSPAGHTG